MKYLLVTILFLSCFLVNSQDKQIDKLEILYDQGYYKKVVRKANKLMANPLYDYSDLPEYYKSISIFHLASDAHYFKKNPKCIFEAIALFRIVENNEKYNDYITAHYYELAELKTYLIELEADFNEKGLAGSSEALLQFMDQDLNGVIAKPNIPVMEEVSGTDEKIDANSPPREKIVVYAKSLVGIKYVWAGTDETGFDCSGFTSYVLKKYGIIVSRTASGQMAEAKKVKIENAQKADLVFFGSGAKVTHVGMVVSKKGAELTMIHASTSKGVIITNVIQSTYWKPKLKGAGTYIED